MISLKQIESDLTVAMKAKDQMAVEVLRGLKTAVQNEQIAKQKELSEAEILAIIKRETKRRKEAAGIYVQGGRQELADKELKESEILEKYLPAQMSEQDIAKIIDGILAAGSFTAKDFGSVMGKLKAQAGNSADGAVLAKLLKEKLK